MESIKEVQYEESVDIIRQKRQSRINRSLQGQMETTPLLALSGSTDRRNAPSRQRSEQTEAPSEGNRIKDEIVADSISAAIGYLFEYIQNALNLVFIANISGKAHGLRDDGTSLAVVILSSALSEVFAKAIYRGLNSSVDCLVPQAQGHHKQHLCWLFYTQAKYANFMATVPIIILIILQGPILSALKYSDVLSKEIFVYGFLSLVGTVAYG
jgi:hypothetical protein